MWQDARQILILATITLLSVPDARGQQPQELSVQKCNALETENWKLIETEMSGAIALDAQSMTIGPYPAKRFIFFENWRPLLETKQPICGTLEHFKIYDFLFGEHDWNLYLKPTARFQSTFEDALTYASDPAQVWHCDPPHSPISSDVLHSPNCFEAEATPLESFRANNPWLKPDNSTSLVEGQQLCAIGPLVSEDVHGGRPELHPLEVVWWSNKVNEHTLWTLLEVQDSSHRFESRSDFAGAPTDWSPWAGSPRQQDLRVAIKVSAGSVEPKVYTVSQVPGCYGNLPSTETPLPPTTRIYTYLGKPILKVNEHRAELGFTVRPQMCLANDNGSDDSLIGYLSIRASIGKGDNEEGYQAIEVTDTGDAPKDTCSDNPIAKLDPLFDTLRLHSTANGRQVLTIDALANVVAERHQVTFETLPLSMMQAGKEIHTRSKMAQQEGKEGLATTIKDIELVPGQNVSLGNSTGLDAELAVHAVVRRTPPKPEDRQKSAKAKPLLVFAAGGTAIPESPEPGVTVQNIVLDVRPQFIATKNGIAEPEEESGVADRLNVELFHKNFGKSDYLAQVFGANTRPPMKIVWTYRGINCGTAPHVDCEHGNGVRVVNTPPPQGGSPFWIFAYVTSPDDPVNSQVNIRFPRDEDSLYQLSLTATATNTLTNTSDMYTYQFWSKEQPVPGLGEGAVKWVMRYAAGAAGVNAGVLSSGTETSADDYLEDVKNDKHRRYSMLRHFASTVAQKGTIEVSDLRRLIAGVRKLSNTSDASASASSLKQ